MNTFPSGATFFIIKLYNYDYYSKKKKKITYLKSDLFLFSSKMFFLMVSSYYILYHQSKNIMKKFTCILVFFLFLIVHHIKFITIGINDDKFHVIKERRYSNKIMHLILFFIFFMYYVAKLQ